MCVSYIFKWHVIDSIFKKKILQRRNESKIFEDALISISKYLERFELESITIEMEDKIKGGFVASATLVHAYPRII